LSSGWRGDLTTRGGGLRLRTLIAGLEFVDAMPQCTDQLVTFCCTGLQRIDAPQQLFHGGFLLLPGGCLCQSWTGKYYD
jgi:hypothetical protein